jgi:hypothetical protein
MQPGTFHCCGSEIAAHQLCIMRCVARCRQQEGSVCREHDDWREADAARALCHQCCRPLGTGVLGNIECCSCTPGTDILWHLQSTNCNSASVDCSMLHDALRVSRSILSRRSTWQGAATSSWKVHWHHLWLNALQASINPTISAFKSPRVATWPKQARRPSGT